MRIWFLFSRTREQVSMVLWEEDRISMEMDKMMRLMAIYEQVFEVEVLVE